MPLSDVFSALGDPVRRRILKMLAERGDLAAGEIAAAFSITKPSVSHHLAALRQAGLVTSHREGQRIIYSLEATVMHEVLAWIYDVLGRGGEKPEGGRDA